DPYNYLLKVRDPDNTLRDLSEAVTRQIVGDRTVNEVLTVGRAEIANEVKALLQDMTREYSLGVQIAQVVLQDINPPESVKQAFNAVNEAQQERETLINEAKSEYNKVIPRARGQAQETIQQAEGYATQRVNNAQGEAARFNALYNEYIKAPEVTKKRIYLETLQEVLPKLGNKIITSENGNNVIPLLKKELN
ncbi:FtsH protease activity modulator HflK, partial [Phaeodactylibacter xiamenensis]|uniref:FtsH protease activity modulator HflK n=1 Tax=Phaeodactylibacter xiamenensis TaxID=1524460 RepID=UPI0024A9D376